MEFYKVRDAVCDGHYDCQTVDEAVQFTALLFYLNFGEYSPKQKTGSLRYSTYY